MLINLLVWEGSGPGKENSPFFIRLRRKATSGFKWKIKKFRSVRSTRTHTPGWLELVRTPREISQGLYEREGITQVCARALWKADWSGFQRNQSLWLALPTISHAWSMRCASHRYHTLSFLALRAGNGIKLTHTRGALTDSRHRDVTRCRRPREFVFTSNRRPAVFWFYVIPSLYPISSRFYLY